MVENYLVKAKYVQNDGGTKATKQTFLIKDCLSNTEAEARTLKHLETIAKGEYSVDKTEKAKYQELYETDKDKLFDVTIKFAVLDEQSGKEKTKSSQTLVGAENIADAIHFVNIEMKKSIMEYEITSVKLSPIIEVLERE